MHTCKHLFPCQTTMTSSKSDLEAKEGQIPNESNFLEFVSLLGSLSTRASGASTQEEEGPERKQDVGVAEEGESGQEGLFLYLHLLYLHVLKALHTHTDDSELPVKYNLYTLTKCFEWTLKV